jgi:ABC-type uncharacterized transport system ATPase subunit
MISALMAEREILGFLGSNGAGKTNDREHIDRAAQDSQGPGIPRWAKIRMRDGGDGTSIDISFQSASL